MKKKILYLSLYPAPYRVDLLKRYPDEYEYDVFFETSGGDERNEEWFRSGEYALLDTPEGSKRFAEIRLEDYALVMLFEYSTGTSVKLITKCKRKKIPYAVNCDGVIMEKHGNLMREAVKRYLISGAAGYFAGSENAKKYFLKYGADEKKIHVHTFSELEKEDILTRPLTTEEKTALRKKTELPLDGKIAIAVGRFIPLKRYDALIAAWKGMPEDHTLLLIGGGSEEAAYRRIIKENGLTNVILHDFMPKEKLTDYYRAADIFVHPTSYDVWGLVINEAMAAGLPVVVSDRCVAGLELIEDGVNGYRIPMGDDQQMCSRVVEITGDAELYKAMSENVLKTIAPYTMTNMAQTQSQAIREMVKS